MKNIDFVPKDVQKIILSHKISDKHNKQDLFCKKAILKNF